MSGIIRWALASLTQTEAYTLVGTSQMSRCPASIHSGITHLESYNTRCSYVENLFKDILLTLLIVPNDNILASPLMYIKWMELPILNTKAEQRQPSTPTYLGGHPHAVYIVSIGFEVLSNPTRNPKGHCEFFFSKTGWQSLWTAQLYLTFQSVDSTDI